MMSRKILLAAAAGIVVAGGMPTANAQSAQKYVVLKNVDAGVGQAEVDGKAAIPLASNTIAEVDGSGNIVVDCALGQGGADEGDCANIGAGSGGPIGNGPTITFNGPVGTVPANNTNARLHWAATNADTCFGINAPNNVNGWEKEWPKSTTNSNGFPVGNLPRSPSADTTYEFTLRCYSSTSSSMGGTPVVAYTDQQHTVTLAKSSGGGTPIPGGDDYCSEYYPEGHPARSQPGFTTDLVKVEKAFEDIFTNGTGAGINMAQLLSGTAGNIRGGAAGPHAVQGQYLAIAFTVPSDIGSKRGFELGMVEPQGYLGLESATKYEVSISPCPGDFRKRPANNLSEDFYDRYQCSRIGNSTKLYASTGTLEAPGSYCFLKPGAKMYINFTSHSLEAFRTHGGQPEWGCPQGINNCGKKVDMKQTSGY